MPHSDFSILDRSKLNRSSFFSLHLPFDDVLMASLGGILTAGAQQLSQLRYHTDKVLSQAENELLTEVNTEYV